MRQRQRPPCPTSNGKKDLPASFKSIRRFLGKVTRNRAVARTLAGTRFRARAPVLYDNVPGGVGHVREPWEQGRELFARTWDVLFVNAEHHRRCDTACLDCLLSFDSQTVATQHGFARRRALELLKELLDAD